VRLSKSRYGALGDTIQAGVAGGDCAVSIGDRDDRLIKIIVFKADSA
jgi:hypothetical protein